MERQVTRPSARVDLGDPAAAAGHLADGGRVVNISSGVTSTALAGIAATGPFAHLTEGQRAEAGAAFGLGRIGEPADTAAVVAFLASAEAGFVTGQVIDAVGGQHGPIQHGPIQHGPIQHGPVRGPVTVPAWESS
jgi:hypothetical protein